MSPWFWIGVALLGGGAVEVVVLWLVGRESEERRGGVLELDTPEAREALGGRACSECGRPLGLSHLGTCSGSLRRGGSGVVGVDG